MSRTLIGKFSDITNENVYYVKIGDPMGQAFYINDSDNGSNTQVMFSGDEPVTIESDMSDTFENVYIRQASINLISNFDIRDMIVATNYTDIPVEIRRDNTTDIDVRTPRNELNSTLIFTGFVVPMSFNQNYAYKWNEFEVECVDKLGILEYVKFQPLLNNNFNYATPWSFIQLALSSAGFSIQQNTINKSLLQYDETESTHINPSIFIGDSEDDWMNCKEVIEEIGKIYGCYFYQNGNVCMIENILLTDTNNPYMIQKEDYRGDDTNISVDEAYNSIKYTVDLSTIDETFVDPFNDEYITNTSWRAERIISEIQHKYKDELGDLQSFIHLCTRGATMANPNYNNDWSNALETNHDEKKKVFDHYGQILTNSMLDFGDDSYLISGHGNATDQGKNGTYHVRDTLKWLYDNPGKGAFVSFGHTQNLINAKDKTIPQIQDMQKMLLIQINGNRSGVADIFSEITNQINNNKPICSFTMNSANSLIPNDVNSTNYLVIEGKIKLNPMVPFCGQLGHWDKDFDVDHTETIAARNQYNLNANNIVTTMHHWDSLDRFNMFNKQEALYWNVTNSDGDGEKDAEDNGAYLQYVSWKNTPEHSSLSDNYKYWPYNQYVDYPAYPNVPDRIAMPPLQFDYKKYKYKGTNVDNGVDDMWYLPILACELKIGDKYLVENLDIVMTYKWQVPYIADILPRYRWLTYDQCPWVDDNDHSLGKVTWFTIGINPGIDDSFLGKEFEIADNVDIRMNIKANGTAIPISYGSNLNGAFSFKILGPYNAVYDTGAKKVNVYTYYPAIGGSSGLGNNVRALLSKTENIQISDLSFKLYSDSNGNSNGTDDSDLVYTSNIGNQYVEDEEQEIKFATSLTSNQAIEHQIDYKPNNSSILKPDGTRWYGMNKYEGYDAGGVDENKIKLEEARVIEQYNFWKRPRNIVETTLKLLSPENAYIKTNYTFDYFKYDNTHYQIYRTFGRTLNLKNNTMLCKMKEISDKPNT